MGVAESREILLVGRLIVGAGIGLASMSVPMYISEASPPHLRGLLVSCNVLVITFGQFVAACVCGVFSKTDQGWKYMLGMDVVSVVKFLTRREINNTWYSCLSDKQKDGINVVFGFTHCEL